MELLDRYLNAVERYLPRAQQADVVAELSDSIQSTVEEREATLGRPLTIDEESAIIKTYGHPIVAASRYRPNQQLIGPALYPFYLNTLKITLFVALCVVAIVALMFWVATDDALAAFAHFWGAIWGTLFVVVGIVTSIFAAVERLGPARYAIRWDPRSLPRVDEPRVARSTSAVELVFNLLFAAWLFDVPNVRALFGSALTGQLALSPFAVGPWCQQLLPALAAVTLVHAAVNCVNLFRPDWTRLRSATMTLTHGFLLVALALVIREHTFVTVSAHAAHPEQYAHAATALNGLVFIGLMCFALICAVMIVVNVLRFQRRTSTLLTAHSAQVR